VILAAIADWSSGLNATYFIDAAWFPTVQGTIALHRDHYLRLDRNLWLRFNALDYSIFLGWPLIVWAAILIVRDRN
jgi:hypothetical protein